jgi:hypothetical protein
MNTVFPDVADSKLSGVRLNTAAEAAVIVERKDRIESFIVGCMYLTS